MAPRFRRNIDRDLPAPDGFGFCRLLSRPLSDFVVSDFARYLARSRRTHQRSPLAGVLGFHFRSAPIFLLAILFGAAAGNVARGVPLNADGNFSMAFFTNFNVRGHVGLLDWYTVSIAILAVVMLAAHGATYLTLKTEGPVHDRSEKWAKYLWIAVVPLLAVVLVESRIVRPDLPRTRLIQSILVDRIGRIGYFNYRASFWPG